MPTVRWLRSEPTVRWLRSERSERLETTTTLVRDAERRHAPPRLALRQAERPDVAEGVVRRSTEVDGRLPAARGRGPGRLQELLAGGHQVVRPAPRPLGVEHQDVGVLGHQVDEHLHVVHEHRSQRLHALDGVPLGELLGDLAQLRVLLAEPARTGPHLVGQQQLAAGRCPEPRGGLERALVGDREGPDLLDLVAPELHAQRVLLGRREDVDDPAADRELAALLDQVDPGVRRRGQPTDHVLEVGLRPDGQLDRLEVGQALDLGLQHGPDRSDHDLERPVAGVVARVREAAQHGQPPPDGVAARREALVRQRLPRRVVADQRRVHQAAERLHQVLRLAGGGGDGQDGPAGVDQPAHDERPQRRRPGQVERGHGARTGVLDRGGQHLVLEDQVGQTLNTHAATPDDGNTITPCRQPRGLGEGVRRPSLRTLGRLSGASGGGACGPSPHAHARTRTATPRRAVPPGRTSVRARTRAPRRRRHPPPPRTCAAASG